MNYRTASTIPPVYLTNRCEPGCYCCTHLGDEIPADVDRAVWWADRYRATKPSPSADQATAEAAGGAR